MARGVNLATIAFLAANLIIRFGSIFNYAPYNGYLAVFFAFILMGSIAVIIHPAFLKFYLAVFGFSFFLFGFGSIDIHSRVFELLVTCVATALFLVNWRNGGDVRVKNPHPKGAAFKLPPIGGLCPAHRGGEPNAPCPFHGKRS